MTEHATPIISDGIYCPHGIAEDSGDCTVCEDYQMREKVARLEMDLEMAIRRVKAVERLNTHYRMGTYPSDALMDELAKTKMGMTAMGQ